jgi:F-type H+-transporting ATPase subunit a
VIALAAAIATAGGEDGGGFHAPTLDDFFPNPLLFEGTPFAMTRINLITLLMTGILSLLVVWAFAKPKVVPRGMQNVGEWAILGMDKAITGEVLGAKGKRYAPYLMSMFFLILFLNSSGILPPMHIPATSVIGVPLVFAVIAWLVFNIEGIRKLGFPKYFKANVAPPGIPKPLYLLVIPVEFVSTFILRPFTLAVRLMANMMAGHILLVLFFSATSYILLEADGLLKSAAVATYAFGFLFTLFEILVIFLQAYIFTLLTAVYIDGALSAEH